MKSVFEISREIWKNLILMHRLAINDLITRHKGNLLGIIWIWVNPTVQIVIYWVVFGSIRNSVPVDGIDFFLWLSVGYTLWNYISGVITPASRSIIGKMGLITKMRFDVSIIPGVIVLSELYVHILLLITIIVILAFSGIYLTIYALQVVYFLFCTVVFLYSFSIFNSSITTVIRDYQHVVYNFMRALFFFTPVVHQSSATTGILGTIMKLNPLTYVIEGYREALLYDKIAMITSSQRTIYFWGITLFLYIVGSILHVKMRKNLLDYA